MSGHLGDVHDPAGEQVLVGSGTDIVAVAGDRFRQSVRGLPARMAHRRDFMTDVHVRVREHAVRELRPGRPLRPEDVAAALELPVPLVAGAVGDLERNLFFLVRAEDGAISWAFPVTAEPTRHRLRFAGGDLLYAA